MTSFRYIGTTDECVECQQCGRVDLRCTVVLAVLDADGNTEDVTYYGSTCAARALSIPGGGREVQRRAEWANTETRNLAEEARGRAEVWQFDPVTGESTAERGWPRTVGNMIRLNGGPGRWPVRAEAEAFTRKLIAESVRAVRDEQVLLGR